MKKNISKLMIATMIAITSTAPVYAYSDKDSLQLESVVANNIINEKGDFTIDSGSDFYTNINGNLYVRLRDITELYGYNIEWKGETKSVKVFNNDSSLEFTVGYGGYIQNDSIAVDNSLVPVIYDSSVYIPNEIYQVFFAKEIEEFDITEYALISDEVFGIMDNFYKTQVMANEGYKKAFLATGGKIEEYREPKFYIGYDVISSGDIISIKVSNYQSLASSYTEEIYLNYNGQTLEKITLAEVLGDGYEDVLKNEILIMMKNRQDSEPEKYVYDYDAFDKVVFDENTSFYFDETGKLVIVFDKYEIAAGAYGKQMFTLENNAILSDSEDMFNNKNEFLLNNKTNFIMSKSEKLKDYFPKYFPEAEHDIKELTDVEVLQMFKMPIFISTNDKNEQRVFIYRASEEDTTAYYIIFDGDKVVDYKIDDFNGEYVW